MATGQPQFAQFAVLEKPALVKEEGAETGLSAAGSAPACGAPGDASDEAGTAGTSAVPTIASPAIRTAAVGVATMIEDEAAERAVAGRKATQGLGAQVGAGGVFSSLSSSTDSTTRAEVAAAAAAAAAAAEAAAAEARAAQEAAVTKAAAAVKAAAANAQVCLLSSRAVTDLIRRDCGQMRIRLEKFAMGDEEKPASSREFEFRGLLL